MCGGGSGGGGVGQQTPTEWDDDEERSCRRSYIKFTGGNCRTLHTPPYGTPQTDNNGAAREQRHFPPAAGKSRYFVNLFYRFV